MLFFLTNVYAYAKYLRLAQQFYRRLGFWPNIAEPASYHEKMLWKKIFDHDPRITELADKFRVKTYVAEIYPDLPFAPVLWSGTDTSKIPESVFDRDVYFKANHGSGFNIRIASGDIDRQRLAKKARQWLGQRYGERYGEWGYWGIERRLFIEETLTSDGKTTDYDFKFYISGGTVCIAYVVIDRFSPDRQYAALDRSGNSYPMRFDGDYGSAIEFSPPDHYAQMVRMAERMSLEFDCVRIDFIADDERFYFGEYTFYSWAGFDWIKEREHPLIRQLNEFWDLRRSWFLTNQNTGLLGRYAKALRNKLDSEAGF